MCKERPARQQEAALFCQQCLKKRTCEPLRSKARSAVARAVKKGILPPAKKMKCVDCGKKASCYDHRDYRKPLKVDPVCKSCDCLRGAGLPYEGFSPFWEERRKAFKKKQILGGANGKAKK